MQSLLGKVAPLTISLTILNVNQPFLLRAGGCQRTSGRGSWRCGPSPARCRAAAERNVLTGWAGQLQGKQKGNPSRYFRGKNPINQSINQSPNYQLAIQVHIPQSVIKMFKDFHQSCDYLILKAQSHISKLPVSTHLEKSLNTSHF